MATALVTGGTSGIGLIFARHLARQGYDLVLVARDRERLDETARDLETTHQCGVEVVTADLSDAGDVDRVAARITDPDHPIELVVNNAGFGIHAPLTGEDLTPHTRALDVMLRAVLVLGGAAGRAMAGRGSGMIINVSSTAGFMTMGGYSAIKAWVTNYSESLSVELRGSGVRVTALCPGWVRTEFHDRAGINTGAIPSRLWIDSDLVVATALRDVRRGKVVSIPSWRFRFLMWCVRHLPRRAVRAISAKISSRRSPAMRTGTTDTQP